MPLCFGQGFLNFQHEIRNYNIYIYIYSITMYHYQTPIRFAVKCQKMPERSATRTLFRHVCLAPVAEHRSNIGSKDFPRSDFKYGNMRFFVRVWHWPDPCDRNRFAKMEFQNFRPELARVFWASTRWRPKAATKSRARAFCYKKTQRSNIDGLNSFSWPSEPTLV